MLVAAGDDAAKAAQPITTSVPGNADDTPEADESQPRRRRGRRGGRRRRRNDENAVTIGEQAAADQASSPGDETRDAAAPRNNDKPAVPRVRAESVQEAAAMPAPAMDTPLAPPVPTRDNPPSPHAPAAASSFRLPVLPPIPASSADAPKAEAVASAQVTNAPAEVATPQARPTGPAVTPSVTVAASAPPSPQPAQGDLLAPATTGAPAAASATAHPAENPGT